ncbi:MAG: hypothetical protein HY884_00505 [Deltaproteobacteria bacterium]|nr:hypothetical protein [Deltaproteobacteria bacterium]
MKVKQGLLKFISPQVPKEGRMKTAAGDFPTEAEILPGDRLTALFVLTHDSDAEVSAAAKKTIADYPKHLLMAGLDEPLDPLVIKYVIAVRGKNDSVMIMAALNPGIDDAALTTIALECNEEAASILTADKVWLASKPFFMEALKKNQLLSKVTIERIEFGLSEEDEKQASAQAPPAGEHKETPQEAPNDGISDKDKDELAADVAKKFAVNMKKDKDVEKNVFKLVSTLSVSQKVKLAMAGNKAARELLVKESNKMVSRSVLKNPRITEDEIKKLVITKGTAEDLLREVARNKEWLENYSIKVGVVTNTKTPIAVSMKMIESLNDADVLKISKSKNVSTALASAARRRLEAKKRK